MHLIADYDSSQWWTSNNEREAITLCQDQLAGPDLVIPVALGPAGVRPFVTLVDPGYLEREDATFFD